RAVSNDLAQAGVRYSFGQLRFSELGADWRPLPPTPVPADVLPGVPPGLGPNSDPDDPAATNPDPDYYWLRRQEIPGNPDPNDRGGPDRLGAYTRINFRNGRALVRVRYAPSGVEIFDFVGPGEINVSGKLRAYTIIESVGRPGAFNERDPTAVRQPHIQNARHLTAVVPIGIIESARYIHNKSHRNQPIDLGIPADFGANFLGGPVAVPMLLGGLVVPAPPGSQPGNVIMLGGPMYINASVRVHGDLRVWLNAGLGEQINISGDLEFASLASTLTITRIDEVGITSVFSALPSNDPAFTTFLGVLRDGRTVLDPQGYPRSVPRKEPPLIDDEDPNTGQVRYRDATRNSGALGTDGFGRRFNLGRLGYGRGVYVDNFGDLARDSRDGDFSQRFDWLNPNNGHPNSAWQGPYYVPLGTYIQLLDDGFIIGRNVRNNNDTWRDYQRSDTGRHVLRFKLGIGSDNRLRIINEFTPGVGSFGSPSTFDFDRGAEFNGLIMCEGNVRVRGVIPDSVQMTIVSMGTAYVEGSIVKGDPDFSTLAILARDNVVINTTQFLSPSFRDTLQIVRDNNNPTSPARIKVDPAHPLHLNVQFPFDPASYTYRNLVGAVEPSLFIAHAAEFDRAAFINLLMNRGFSATPEYLFENVNPPNAAAPFYPPGPPIPTYGLADPSTQVLPVFEKRRFQIYPPDPGVRGDYLLFLGAFENELELKKDGTISPPQGNADYFVSRAAVVPGDVEIHAVLYAQEGSFFVIPGPWFNPNPNDRRDNFVSAIDRAASFSASVEYPFYGEPLDIKITIFGSVSENFPPQMADQADWLRHWGWIPAEVGESGRFIPNEHNPGNRDDYAPNLFINYDPILISGRPGGSFNSSVVPPIRVDDFGRTLPPMPKLPVGTKLFYFGELNP
ncbi:MAG: hypothetical protein IH851_08805, partial [Armatimonadetes bacterium]|nr:hypothetical protein [Armatimonadota bacterium]